MAPVRFCALVAHESLAAVRRGGGNRPRGARWRGQRYLGRGAGTEHAAATV